jgi:hypothetical protein
MNPNERQELAKKFSGLDKVLYERFEKKARMDKIDRILNYVFLGIR